MVAMRGRSRPDSDVSLAIVCPTGFLQGYSAVWRECVASMARAADWVYLMHSTREDTPDYLPANVQLVSDARTWFRLDESWRSHFDVYRICENMAYGVELAAADGFDQAAVVFCNWYVSEKAAESLRRPVDGWGWDASPG